MICKKQYYEQYNSETLPDRGVIDGISRDRTRRNGVVGVTSYQHFIGAVNPNFNQGIVLNLTDQEQEYRRQFNGGSNRLRERYYKQCAVCFLAIVGITLYVVNFL
jgi:hypothetical protein